MIIPRKKLSGFFVFVSAVILASSFVSAVLGLGHMGIRMDADGKMAMRDCPFMPSMSICPMTLFEHLNSWQNMFTTTAPGVYLAALLVLLAMMLWMTAVFRRDLLLEFSSQAILWQLYLRNNVQLSLFNFLQEFLSRGILNPKAY